MNGKTSGELASRTDRLFAALIDLFLLYLGGTLFNMVGFHVEKKVQQPLHFSFDQIGGWEYLFINLFHDCFLWLLLVIINAVLLVKYGQSIGKYLMKIHIVGVQTMAKVSWQRILLLRPLLFLLLIFCALFPWFGVMIAMWFPTKIMVGGLMIFPVIIGFLLLVDCLLIFREDRKCLHDLIARTIVVNK